MQKLFRRYTSDLLIAPQLAARLTRISGEIKRTVGLLINRSGKVEHVVVGDAQRLYLPDIGRQRAGTGRLRGLRLIRSQLGGPGLKQDDLTDLVRLRLDLVATLAVGPSGHPAELTWAHLRPASPGEAEISDPQLLHESEVHVGPLIEALEAELRRAMEVPRLTGGVPGLLVGVKTKGDWYADQRLSEMHELAKTAGLEILDTVVQQRFKVHPRTVVGPDKLEEIELRALDAGAEILVFGRDLTPAQVRAISERTELKVIDRTQLILDIFAQHAKSRGGKLQVELAQLKYMLPRLVAKATAMSRLTGGIGGRGPGETKLEINRRRARDRIQRLSKEIDKLSAQRERQRARRKRRHVPVVAIIGYTNAGKSTLLNTLTKSDVIARAQLFATLDPTSRRLRFPRDRELVLTDTVGFIHDLPKELMAAFKATLEELADAHLLVHLVDGSADGFERQIEAVNTVLKQLDLMQKPQLLVLNKCDLVDPTVAANLAKSYGALTVSAPSVDTLQPLVDEIQRRLWTDQLKRESDGRALA